MSVLARYRLVCCYAVLFRSVPPLVLTCRRGCARFSDELCLSKYRDGRWYRARILDVYPPSEEGAPTEYEVFYIDYGAWLEAYRRWGGLKCI